MVDGPQLVLERLTTTTVTAGRPRSLMGASATTSYRLRITMTASAGLRTIDPVTG